MSNNFFELVKEECVKFLMLAASLLSFFIANVFVLILLANYFTFQTNFVFWAFSVTGSVISFALIRSNLVIRPFIFGELKSLRKSASKISQSAKKIKLGKWNLSIIITRLLFFNVLNDLFIILIVWASFFAVISLAGLISLKEGKFQDLAAIVGIIGVLSGLFQVYFQAYKEQYLNKMTDALTNYFIRISRKTSFKNFLAFLKEKDKSFFNTVEQKLKANPLAPILKIFRDQRSGRDTTNITLNVFTENDAILVHALEFSDIDKITLKKKYVDFFKEKTKETHEELDKLDINELKRILLPNILFFDETAVDLIKVNYVLEDVSEPQSFEEFRAVFVRENVEYLINKISGFD